MSLDGTTSPRIPYARLANNRTEIARFERMYAAVLLLMLALLPFIQLGAGYYASTMFVGWIILFLSITTLRCVKWPLALLALLITIMMLPAVSFIGADGAFHSVLRASREFLCLLLPLVTAMNLNVLRRSIDRVAHKAGVAAAFLVILFFLIVVVQRVGISTGRLYFLPEEWFVLNTNTIPTYLDLQWTKVRPSGTFGEPSYMGFVASALLCIVLASGFRTHLKAGLAAVLLLLVLISNTAAGILACAGIQCAHLASSRMSLTQKLTAFGAVLTIGVIATSFGYINVIERIANIGDKDQERSGYSRIVAPLQSAGGVLLTHPFGVPAKELPSLLPRSIAEKAIDESGNFANSWLNLLMNYGVGAFVIVATLFAFLRKTPTVLTFFLFCGFFNGSLLSFDKSIVLSLVIAFAGGAFLRSEALAKGPRPRLPNLLR